MDNKKNKKKGIWIPEKIKVDKKLDWTNKALLSEIYSLCELPDGCIASDNHFGRLLGIGRTSVNKRVNKLEKMGYIISENIFDENNKKLCIGRKITKGSSYEKHTLVPKVSDGSSSDSERVVPKVVEGSSLENTINSNTNSISLIQEPIQYTGETKNIGKSMVEVFYNRLEELSIEAVEKSSLGENIFFYAEPTTIDLLKESVGEEEYKLVFPVLKRIIEVEKKLSGR